MYVYTRKGSCRSTFRFNLTYFFFSLQVGDVEVEVSLRCPWPPGSDVSDASTGTGLLRKNSSKRGGDRAVKGRSSTDCTQHGAAGLCGR